MGFVLGLALVVQIIISVNWCEHNLCQNQPVPLARSPLVAQSQDHLGGCYFSGYALGQQASKEPPFADVRWLGNSVIL